MSKILNASFIHNADLDYLKVIGVNHDTNCFEFSINNTRYSCNPINMSVSKFCMDFYKRVFKSGNKGIAYLIANSAISQV